MCACIGGPLEVNAYSISVPAVDDRRCGQTSQPIIGLGRLCAGYRGQNIGLCKVVLTCWRSLLCSSRIKASTLLLGLYVIGELWYNY